MGEVINNGFYVLGEECLCDIKNNSYLNTGEEDNYNHHEDAGIFLHGSCHLFAKALYEKFGYSVYQVDTTDNKLVHVFCKTVIAGREFYVDARGYTTSIDELLAPFHLADKNTMHKIDEKTIYPESPAEENGYEFAKYIVENHSYFYSYINS